MEHEGYGEALVACCNTVSRDYLEGLRKNTNVLCQDSLSFDWDSKWVSDKCKKKALYCGQNFYLCFSNRHWWSFWIVFISPAAIVELQ